MLMQEELITCMNGLVKFVRYNLVYPVFMDYLNTVFVLIVFIDPIRSKG